MAEVGADPGDEPAGDARAAPAAPPGVARRGRDEAVRLIHVSDVHLGSDADPLVHLAEFRAFARLVAAEGPDAVLISGDFFENNRVAPGLVEPVMEILGRLPRVVLLPGNHDACGPGTVYRRFAFDALAPRVRVILDPGGACVRLPGLPVTFWGRPTVEHAPSFRPLADVPPPPGHGWGVLLAHGEHVPAGPTLIGSPIYDADLDAARGWDYVALGHRPVPVRLRDDPPACYAGDLVTREPGVLACVSVTLRPDEGAEVALRRLRP